MDKPVGKGFANKHRSAGVVTGDLFVGGVAEDTALGREKRARHELLRLWLMAYSWRAPPN
jgi:hypothetical protein